MARRNGEAIDAVDDRRTPRSLWRLLEVELGPFTLDAAASKENALCDLFFTRDDDGLHQPWSGVVWCNPPFSDLPRWVAKGWHEAPHCTRIVMLVPSNRTEQPWWQMSVEPHRDRDRNSHGARLRTRFLAGRPRFGGGVTCKDGKGSRPPFGVALLIWEPAR